MIRCRRQAAPVLLTALFLFAWAALHGAVADAAPEGQMTWGLHTTLVPGYFDPAEWITGTPVIVLYAIHDAIVKRLPGNSMAPSLAESWSASPDGLVYDFVLRKGVRFHNGEPVTAEDVKFSFERYRGIFAKSLRDRTAAVEVVDPGRVRFRLRQPWPDFMMTYASASGASWVVPKKYVETVGDEGFRKAPIGAGTISDEATRLATLKRGDTDVVYLLGGELATEVKRTPGYAIKPVFPSSHWLLLAHQFDPKSPWHDGRVRLAANLAIDRHALNEAATLGLSKLTGSIVPSSSEFAWPAPPYPYDPARARQLLAEAGYPNGFDAGELYTDVPVASWGEVMLTYLKAVKIQLELRPMERATFFKAIADRKLKNGA